MYYWPERKNQRLKNYNYSSVGYYFVTFCSKGRIDYFWEIQNWEMILNDYGEMLQQSFIRTQEIRKEIDIDEYIIMPNHIHVIIIIQNPVGNAGMRSKPGGNYDSGQYTCGPYEDEILSKTKNVLSNCIQWLKAYTTKEIRQNYGDYEFAWQKSFHDVIIRNQDQLDKTREYIRMNPSKWEEDINNQINIQAWKK